MYIDASNQQDPKHGCMECGGFNLVERIRNQEFTYGKPGQHVLLTASMPVFSCEDCGFEYFDERGEAARHDAICRHLGVHTPEEMRCGREESGLSRTELSDLSGAGIASIQRWESGAVVPNQSSDRLLYLLRFRSNIELLRSHLKLQASLEPEEIVSDDLSSSIEPKSRACSGHAMRSFPRLRNKGRSEIQASQWNLRSR